MGMQLSGYIKVRFLKSLFFWSQDPRNRIYQYSFYTRRCYLYFRNHYSNCRSFARRSYSFPHKTFFSWVSLIRPISARQFCSAPFFHRILHKEGKIGKYQEFMFLNFIKNKQYTNKLKFVICDIVQSSYYLLHYFQFLGHCTLPLMQYDAIIHQPSCFRKQLMNFQNL